MSDIIYPRSPRETMCGWAHLPRLIDKIRLHLAGKLHADYQANYGRGFDGLWLEKAGVTLEQLTEVVKRSITDGEVADWVARNVRKTEAEKRAHLESMVNRPAPGDEASQARFVQRKAEAGLSHRDDIRTFLDVIEADEKRL